MNLISVRKKDLFPSLKESALSLFSVGLPQWTDLALMAFVCKATGYFYFYFNLQFFIFGSWALF